MKTNKFALSLIAAAAITAASSSALATDMYIDLGDNKYDDNQFLNNGNLVTGAAFDADTTTAWFTEFGFTQLLATSVYDLSTNLATGTTFFDTNRDADFTSIDLTAGGVSGTSFDGTTTVNLDRPTAGQVNVDSLAPLSAGDDVEGFGNTWVLTTDYYLEGVIGATGPVYTSGNFTVNFESLLDSADNFQAIEGTLTGSNFTGGNLDLLFDITAAADDFLYVSNSSGTFFDVNDLIANGGLPTLKLDTNVNPPIPTGDQLLDIKGTGVQATRQTTLDGTFVVNVPEPSSIAIFGAGLLALAGLRRKAK